MTKSNLLGTVTKVNTIKHTLLGNF